MARQISKALMPVAVLGIFSFGLAAADAEDPKQTGPVALVMQYKCPPAQRAEFRRKLVETALPQFARWQSDGLLAGYHLLFSRYVDTNSWDALALLTFQRYIDVAHWRTVEETMPAGLTGDALALTSSIETYPVDLIRQAASADPSSRPVYLVVPYAYSVGTPAYLKYADDYVTPQFQGWIQEGILSSYQLYVQRYTAARPWDSMIFLKYKDDESFGQREKVVAKIRAQLQSNPVWKAAGDNKQSLRVEKEAIIADELVPRR